MTLEASRFTGPVYTNGRYDLVIALDASDGVHRVLETEFDAVVVDIRIEPGNDPDWISLWNQLGKDKIQARLGIHLLYSFLNPAEAMVKLGVIPVWISPVRFGVLTVESYREVEQDLKKLDILAFNQKTANTPKTTLLELIEKIVAANKSPISEGG
jgi:hypothetical protein